MWAGEMFEHMIIDKDRARELYANGKRPVIFTRRPLDFFFSGYHYARREENDLRMDTPETFRQFCERALLDHREFMADDSRTLSPIATISWAGPNVQLNHDLEQKKAVYSNWIDIDDVDRFYNYCDKLAGRSTTRTKINRREDVVMQKDYFMPDLQKKISIVKRCKQMFSVNKFWAGYTEYDG